MVEAKGRREVRMSLDVNTNKMEKPSSLKGFLSPTRQQDVTSLDMFVVSLAVNAVDPLSVIAVTSSSTASSSEESIIPGRVSTIANTRPSMYAAVVGLERRSEETRSKQDCLSSLSFKRVKISSTKEFKSPFSAFVAKTEPFPKSLEATLKVSSIILDMEMSGMQDIS